MAGTLVALCLAAAALMAPRAVHAAAAAAKPAAAEHPTTAFWRDIKGVPTATGPKGTEVAVRALKARTVALDRLSLGGALQGAPMERSAGARSNPLVIALPDPSGAYQRFAVEESPVMEPGLAAKHPEIKTYAGRGLDDTTANIRISVTPLGFQASVRSKQGSWYIDPYYHQDESLYASFYRRDVPRNASVLKEGLLGEAQLTLGRGIYRARDVVEVRGAGFVPGGLVAITVRGPGDVAPRQLVHATASADGTVTARLRMADPYKTLGQFSVSATDGRSSATGSYEVRADGVPLQASTGPQLRTYRLALLSDPGYATYHGAANVTAAKAALINRVTQIYESETSIRLVLIANNDVLNLNTAAQFSGTNGPCGATACFPTASVSCSSATLTRNRQVIGLLVGASNFDIGHIGVGAGGGGIASLGVVGRDAKAQGCTGLPTPTGDLFAVDYVAHEMGHQFAGNHTFNGVSGSCSGGNRSAANSVEPGSGTSIMAYAGICGTDDTQPHSDPYWTQRSFEEITAYVNGADANINEIQQAALTGFVTDGLQFVLRYNGNDSVPIVRGTNFTTAGIAAAVQAIPGWPAGGTVTVSALTDAGFTLTFGGTLSGVNVAELQVVNVTGSALGYIGEIARGGLTNRGGNVVTATGNSAPVVTTTPSYTIPLRTPFALSGSATDADGDTLTYMWEQTDRGGTTGTSLISNTKTNGPLFRQFGTYANVTSAGTLQYNSPGENAVGTNPTRVFPDMAQILLNNTNADTGACPVASAPPTIPQIDCFSEFLPTVDYVGFAGVNASPLSLNFRLTARDGKGGVGSSTTTLLLAPGAGPFQVTSPNTAVTVDGVSFQTITWNVANTNVAPVNTANVKISLSIDGGNTWRYVLAASTPNVGSRSLQFPNVNTTAARVKIEAVDNVFFDVSNVDFTIRMTGDLNSDGKVDCGDLNIVRAAFGTSVGQPGFDPRADTNNDGVVNVLDLAYVAQRVTVGVRCPV